MGNLQVEVEVKVSTIDWTEKNATGRQRAVDLVYKMRETGDITLFLAECRKLEEPFYDGIGVGFFTAIAAEIVVD